MKKTLLSVLAGLTVMGSAFAAPTPEDRKALCDLLIEKGTHVWVKKTQACIPINPCKSEDPDIVLGYCISVTPMLIEDERQAKLFLERYAQNVLKAQITGIDHKPDFTIATTSDGGYYAVETIADPTCIKQADTASRAYGKYLKIIQDDHGGPISDKVLQIPGIDQQTCEDIKDFHNLLYLTTETRIFYRDAPNGPNCIIDCLNAKD